MLYNKEIFKRCFDYPKKYWYKNILAIPTYLKQIHFLIKNGYDECAEYETFDWFIVTMRKLLTSYQKNSKSIPIVTDIDESIPYEENEKAWNAIITKMITLLNDMDESNHKYKIDYTDISNNKDKIFNQVKNNTNLKSAAKDEFFKLFSKYFYCMWD